MTFKVADRVKESCTSPGTGTVTLLGAVTEFQSFSSAIGANNTTYYVIADQSGANWEIGLGTVGAGGTTLARTTVLASSNGGSLTNFSSGSQYVWVDYPAAKAVIQDPNGNASVNCLFEGFTSVAASGTAITLTAASVQNWAITGSGGQTIKLPDATTLPNGALFTFNNNQSSGTIVIQNNSGTTVATTQSGAFIQISLLSNSIAAGSWDYHNVAPSNASWSTNTLSWAGSYTNGTWNGNAIGASYGGSGQTSLQTSMNTFAGAVTSGSYLRGNGTNVVMSAIQAADVPTLNQNTTGQAGSVANSHSAGTGLSGTAFNGSSAQTWTLATAYGDSINPYASKTANYFLAAPNGSAGVPTFRAIVAADIPTLNQNTTGTASNVTGTVAVANGGTGLTTTPANGALDIGNGSGFTRATLTAGGGISITNGAGSITIATNTYSASYLIVSGGGGSAGSNTSWSSGGGGGGGVLQGTTTLVLGTVYSITVGSGGTAGTAPSGSGGSGGNSTFNGLTAIGGGGSTTNNTNGLSGGSGGGASGSGYSGGSGTSGQGYAGGNGNSVRVGAGGGGAGAVGTTPTANGYSIGSNPGVAGGVGIQSAITGSNVYYAGGGGSGAEESSTVGVGGSGGGGNGGATSTTGTAGTANTGGGAGGSGNNSNSNTYAVGTTGGSGVVILSVPTANYTGTVTGSPTVTTSGANTIIKFTASGSYTA